jgi:photosystem II stability/assembly factor-like uncharacterized protein
MSAEPTHHLDIEDLIAWARGTSLNDEKRVHLATCSACRRDAEQWRVVALGVGHLGAAVPPPPSFRQDLLHGADPDARHAELPVVVHPRRRRTLVAAAAAALLVIGAVSYGLVATLGGVQNLNTAGPHPANTAGPHPVAAPQWKLVGDVSPAWHEVGTLSSNPGLSLTCPSAETCFAADSPSAGGAGLSTVEVTTDGGQSWTSSKLPVTLRGLDVPLLGQTRIACASASTCAVLGLSGASSCPSAQSCTISNSSAVFEETTNGGTSWTARAGPPALGAVPGVSAMACPSASTCLAIANGFGPAAAYVTTDGGQTWATEQLPAGFVPRNLQCSSPTNCVVTGLTQSPGGVQNTPEGTVLHTTDGGGTWTTASLPSGLGLPSTVSCPTSTDCLATFLVAGGQTSEVLASTDSGATWASVPTSGLPGGVALSIACSTATQCWAAGVTDAEVSAEGMTIEAGATPWLASTSNEGKTWQSLAAPDGVSLVASLSCPSVAKCYALALAKPTGAAFASVVLLSYGD